MAKKENKKKLVVPLDFSLELEFLSREYGEIHTTLWNKGNLFKFLSKKQELDYLNLSEETSKIFQKIIELREDFSKISDQFSSEFVDTFNECMTATIVAVSGLSQYLSQKHSKEIGLDNEEGQAFNEYFSKYKEYVKSTKKLEDYVSKNSSNL